MPEEINRLATDAISDVYRTPSPDANEHLKREGVDPAKIDFVGNIMIDSYEMMRGQIETDVTRAHMNLVGKSYGVVTLHRPANVDNEAVLSGLVRQLVQISGRLPLVFAVHPRTRKRLQDFGLLATLEATSGITLTEPLGYIQFMNLVTGATGVVTDSGGVQEESTYLGIPCLTLRENTERPITVKEGSNRLVPVTELGTSLQSVLDGKWNRGRRPDLRDGQTAGRCVAALARRSGVA